MPLQKNRRNLTDGEMLSCLSELDKLRQAGRPSKELAQHCANLDKGKSAQETAKALGVSVRKVEQGRTIQDHADEETIRAVNRLLAPQYFGRAELSLIPQKQLSAIPEQSTLRHSLKHPWQHLFSRN